MQMMVVVLPPPRTPDPPGAGRQAAVNGKARSGGQRMKYNRQLTLGLLAPPRPQKKRDTLSDERTAAGLPWCSGPEEIIQDRRFDLSTSMGIGFRYHQREVENNISKSELFWERGQH